MSWLTKTLSSSIGKKVLMSLTGLFLCTFLLVHLIGNLQLFKNDGGYAFNKYAVFMTTFPLIKIVSYVNYALILFHAFWGLYLEYQNRKARPVAYAVVRNQSSFSSRNMAILGTILLVYIVVHMGDFWYKFHNEPLPYVQYTENVTSGEIVATTMAMKKEINRPIGSHRSTADDFCATNDILIDPDEFFIIGARRIFILEYTAGILAHAHSLQTVLKTTPYSTA